mgnify:FL=1
MRVSYFSSVDLRWRDVVAPLDMFLAPPSAGFVFLADNCAAISSDLACAPFALTLLTARLIALLMCSPSDICTIETV